MIRHGNVVVDSFRPFSNPCPTFASLSRCFGLPKCPFCSQIPNQDSTSSIMNCFTITLNLKSHGDYEPRLTCYLLTSLRDHSINYIGTTTQRLNDRLSYHNTGSSHLGGKYPQKKGPWICTAIATGFGNDVQVMPKFQRAWSKEKEQAVASLRHRVHFDMITRIGKILKGCPEFRATPIKLTQRFKFAHNQI